MKNNKSEMRHPHTKMFPKTGVASSKKYKHSKNINNIVLAYLTINCTCSSWLPVRACNAFYYLLVVQ